MRQKAPRSGVPLRRKEIPPVLSDQPGAEESCGLGAACQLPDLREAAGEDQCEHGESQCELVDPKPAEIHARAEPVAFQAEHRAKVDGKR